MRRKITKGETGTFPYISFGDKHHIIRLPASLGQLVNECFEAGEFKYFGSSKRVQLRAKEGVLWLLSTIYNKNISRGEDVCSPVPLPWNAMEERFGKENTVTWSKLKKFCSSPRRAFILDDGFYNETKCYYYQLNPNLIDGPDEYYYHLQQTVIIKKRIAEINRFAERSRNSLPQEDLDVEQPQQCINRLGGIEATLTNLDRLVLDRLELDRVCRLMLNISLDELIDWANKVKYGKGGCFKVSFSQSLNDIEDETAALVASEGVKRQFNTGGGNKDNKVGNKTLYISHSVPMFYSKSESVHTLEQKKNVLRQRQLFQSLSSLLLGTEEKSVFTDAKGGRLYSPVTNLKREVRRALRFKNEAGEMDTLVNLDVKSCQPWILGIAILRDFQKQGLTPPPDVIDYLELIEGADFYNAIVDHAGLSLTPENRDKVKKSVMKDFYRSKYYNKHSTKISDAPQNLAGKFVAQRFPAVWQWLIDNKGLGEKSLVPVMMQKLEADYFIDKVLTELRDKSIWCLTIHDSVLVRADDAFYVEHYLKTSMMEFFGRCPRINKEEYVGVAQIKEAA